MPDHLDPDELVELAAENTEFDADVVASALKDQGVPAVVFGGMTSGFRAHVPGLARVMVHRRNLDAARSILRAIKAESIDIDWDEVDVGELEDDAPATPPRWRNIGEIFKALLGRLRG